MFAKFERKIKNALAIAFSLLLTISVFGQDVVEDNRFVIISKQLNKDVKKRSEVKIVYGIMNPSGKILISPQFAEIKALGFSFIAAKSSQSSKYGVYLLDGTKVTEAIFDDIWAFSREEKLSRFKQNDSWGFLDTSFKTIVPPVYSYVRPFREGKAAVLMGKKYGYIDKTGKIVINPLLPFFNDNEMENGEADSIFSPRQLSETVDFSRGKAVYKDGNKYGFIDSDGKISISAKFDKVRSFSNQGKVTIVGNRVNFKRLSNRAHPDVSFEYFLLDERGSLVSSQKFLYLGLNINGLISAIPFKTLKVLKSTNTKKKEEMSLEELLNYREAGEYIVEDLKFGFINSSGEWVINPRFPYEREYEVTKYYFVSGVAIVPREEDKGMIFKNNDTAIKYSFIDSSGKYLNDVKFSIPFGLIQGFVSNNLAIVGTSDNYPTLFYETSLYEKDDNAVHELNAQYFGFMDKSGIFVIPPRFQEASPFRYGLAEVKGNKDCQNEGSCYIDKTGKYIYYDENALLPKEFVVKD